jgi:hypothetical protein
LKRARTGAKRHDCHSSRSLDTTWSLYPWGQQNTSPERNEWKKSGRNIIVLWNGKGLCQKLRNIGNVTGEAEKLLGDLVNFAWMKIVP